MANIGANPNVPPTTKTATKRKRPGASVVRDSHAIVNPPLERQALQDPKFSYPNPTGELGPI